MARAAVHTGAIAERYHRDGFFFPLDVLSESQALACRAELERLEGYAAEHKLGTKGQLNCCHVVFRFADELVRHPRILHAQSEALYQGTDAA